MQNIISKSLLTLLLITAQAQAAPSAITCLYNRGEKLTLVAANKDIDLTWPDAETVDFYVNGAPQPTTFTVHAKPTKVGASVSYTNRHPFFVSDIGITYNSSFHKDETTFNGNWFTDTAPITLSCAFDE